MVNGCLETCWSFLLLKYYCLYKIFNVVQIECCTFLEVRNWIFPSILELDSTMGSKPCMELKFKLLYNLTRLPLYMAPVLKYLYSERQCIPPGVFPSKAIGLANCTCHDTVNAMMLRLFRQKVQRYCAPGKWGLHFGCYWTCGIAKLRLFSREPNKSLWFLPYFMMYTIIIIVIK